MENIFDFKLRLRTPLMLEPWNPESPAPHFEQYIRLYQMEQRLTPIPMPEYINHMTHQGIDKGLVYGGAIRDNSHLIDLMQSAEGKHFLCVAGLDHPQYNIRRNLEELEICHQAGFVGVNVVPYIWGVKANDKSLYPIYAYCERHRMVAIVHGSIHFNRYQNMWLGDPKYMDEIAMRFPELKLIISHAANGFGHLGLALAQKHPNIYLGFSALWPKYLQDFTLKAVNSYLKHRCIFGSDYPVVEFAPAIQAWQEALDPEVWPYFFRENANRCLFDEPIPASPIPYYLNENAYNCQMN